MKKKISKDQLELLPIGKGENAAPSFTRWHDERLKSETNWLFNIAQTARTDYERNAPHKSNLKEIADIKHSAWGKFQGEMYSVAQARATLKFLSRFRDDQCQRVRRLRQFCAELNERGFDTTQIDQFIDMEGC